MSIERLGQIWPEWKMESLLGEGSYGKVYKAVREEHGITTYSAIKVITIPKSDTELASMRSEGWSEVATKTYLQGIVDDFINEIKMMEAMKGTTNIVSVEDYKVMEKSGNMGWDIFIRMELLTSFNDYLSNQIFPEEKVIIIGEHILKALELCAQRNIIHRDIKPENIFISSFGYYKLGDFGIARELEKTSGGMTQIGTYDYVAPEVAASRHYDATVDTYSLGIVLYRLLNNNRLPFVDPKAQMVQYQDKRKAIDRRIIGEPLPVPLNASQSMAQVILKACAFNPRDRYQTPTEFMRALEMVRAGGNVPDFTPTERLDVRGADAFQSAQQAKHDPHGQNMVDNSLGGRKPLQITPLIIAISIALVIALGIGVYFILINQASNNNANQVAEVIQNGDYSQTAALSKQSSNAAAAIEKVSKAFDAAEPIFEELKQTVAEDTVDPEDDADPDLDEMETEIKELIGYAGQLDDLLSGLSGLPDDMNTSEGKTVSAAREYITMLKNLASDMAELGRYGVDLYSAVTVMDNIGDDAESYQEMAGQILVTTGKTLELLEEIKPPAYLAITHGDLVTRIQEFHDFAEDFYDAAEMNDPLRTYSCIYRLGRIGRMFTLYGDNLQTDMDLQSAQAERRINGPVTLLHDELSRNLSLLKASLKGE